MEKLATMQDRYESAYSELRDFAIIDALSMECDNEDIALTLPWYTFGDIEDELGKKALLDERIVDIAKTDWRAYKTISDYYVALCSLPLMYEKVKNDDWDLTGYTTLYPSVIPDAFYVFYDDMPEEYRRDFAISCYEHVGDNYESCRRAVRNLPKRGLEELPEEYRNKAEIVVYRAGEEEADEAPDRISWTLDEDKARWFLNEYGMKHANYLYRAKIRPCDVIAYSDDRDEKEVMQYQSVYDVEKLEG